MCMYLFIVPLLFSLPVLKLPHLKKKAGLKNSTLVPHYLLSRHSTKPSHGFHLYHQILMNIWETKTRLSVRHIQSERTKKHNKKQQTSFSIAQTTASDWNTRRIAEIGFSASSMTPSANPLSKAPTTQKRVVIRVEVFHFQWTAYFKLMS